MTRPQMLALWFARYGEEPVLGRDALAQGFRVLLEEAVSSSVIYLGSKYQYSLDTNKVRWVPLSAGS